MRPPSSEHADPPDLAAVRRAAERIAGHVHATPVFHSRDLDRLAGAALFFKAENLQRIGAFKARGAANAVFSLAEDEACRGVVTHSSGNHGAALALAAAARGIPCRVVVPEGAPAVKLAAIAALGAEIVRCAPTLAAREETTARVLAETGAVLVHPYDDPRVIAGQGTAALELLAAVPDLDRIVVPVGGGGLASGTAIAAHGLAPGVRVTGAEPAAADDAARSLAAGRIEPAGSGATIADGLRATLSARTFGILSTHLDRIVVVPDEATVAALRLVWERLKLVIEPSSAVAVAAVLTGGAVREGERVGVILTGGNVDLDRLPWGGDGEQAGGRAG